MRKFAIFYEDGSVVEGGGDDDELVTITIQASRKWLEAPNDGIEFVVEENPHTCRFVWRDSDYYYSIPNAAEYCATNDIGSLLRVHFKGLIKFGTCTTSETLAAIYQRVKAYTRIPRKCQRIEDPTKDDG